MEEGGGEPPAGWPATGALRYQQVTAVYRPGLPPVLRGLSFEISAGQSCGLVGRTGSGKSSLMLTLFRWVPAWAAGSQLPSVVVPAALLQGLSCMLGRGMPSSVLGHTCWPTPVTPAGPHQSHLGHTCWPTPVTPWSHLLAHTSHSSTAASSSAASEHTRHMPDPPPAAMSHCDSAPGLAWPGLQTDRHHRRFHLPRLCGHQQRGPGRSAPPAGHHPSGPGAVQRHPQVGGSWEGQQELM